MESNKMWLVSIAVGVFLSQQLCYGYDVDLTIELEAGGVDCFSQHMKGSGDAELEYQVIDGGELDIDFWLYSPEGRLLQSDQRKTENTVQIKVDVEGDYKFCFDNSFSRMAAKIVFFELMGDSDDSEDEDWTFDMEEIREMVDMTLDEIKGIIERSKGNLDKSIQLQLLLKMFEARDRNVVEANLSRVNMFSAFQVFVMITVSLTQVLMIRSLFQEKNYHNRPGLKQTT